MLATVVPACLACATRQTRPGITTLISGLNEIPNAERRLSKGKGPGLWLKANLDYQARALPVRRFS